MLVTPAAGLSPHDTISVGAHVETLYLGAAAARTIILTATAPPASAPLEGALIGRPFSIPCAMGECSAWS